MVWDVLNVIGTIAFAISGAIIAIEVKYDIIGTYALGLITAFAGGAVRNLLIGIPITVLWQQTELFIIAIITITIVFLFPEKVVHRLKELNLFDSIGLSSFAVQGAMYAHSVDLPIIAIMFSAAITGAGGGIIRDVLAQQKPLVFQKEVYLLWAMLAGFIIGMGWATESYQFYTLFVLILILRVMSYQFGWCLPTRTSKSLQGN
ncbi:trimeric intracellular cation channel family protein [Schinkia azotoformans]|uniref:trimeric intracellular cation channel family protein n=1 Tax=Schinkia azotoformans TaxID=1454 RepID=UPI002DB7DECF|nr:trimeric intracellular cation channel family protein [Schinkia azotoformans]MEC1714274.1 trimeric intracellular cation channel family protein [Schinkia azotoformans]MEC1740804.1 trimeric intracellular cation channel family protein [Schinkia azotoformans]MEC1743924.1 trimeric intracellular cation channel family protein [Schinkia azotoformans]MEC1758819.1 trimeric intracellular cation channel family protein [Schinkia azotoformans]MEC1765238.1 trimeric intracellular cation channel family prote